MRDLTNFKKLSETTQIKIVVKLIKDSFDEKDYDKMSQELLGISFNEAENIISNK